MAITKINTPELFDLGSTNTSLQLPSGNTASRPSSPSTGEWRFNTDDNKVEYWDGSAWTTIDDEGTVLTASENFNVNTYIGNGSTQTIDAKFNEAAAFNGSSSRIETGYVSNLTSASYSFWVKVTSGINERIISSLSPNPLQDAQIDVVLLTGNIVQFGLIVGGSFVSASASTALSTNVWYHIALTYSSGGFLKGYINGTEEASLSIGSLSTGSNTTALNIGYYPRFGTYELAMTFDQLRIFNTALTQQQVTDLYTNETTDTAGVLNFPTGAGCIAAYQLDGDASDVGGTYGGVPTDIGYTGLQFQPDFVWIKNRDYSGGISHFLADSIRGGQQRLASDTASAEVDLIPYGDGVMSFNSNGFTVADDPNGDNGINGQVGGTYGSSYVAWCFKGGGTAVSNTDGTITSSVSANQDAGFSIVKYTGTGSSGMTVGHGLSSAPEIVFIKNLDAAEEWQVFGTTFFDRMNLNDSDADKNNYPITVNSTTFQTSQTSPQEGNAAWNGSGQDYIAYCFHSVDGYSKIGSYTGNGSTSNIIETGFEPAFIMIKRTDTTSSWYMLDNERIGSNNYANSLYANLSNAEDTTQNANGYYPINFLSNGFELLQVTAGYNASGGTYIYLAIAADAQPAPVLANSFDIVTYTGGGASAKSITSLDFQPDFVWIKSRTSALSHVLHDTLTQPGLLISNGTNALIDNGSNTVTFTSNGFDLQGGASHTSVNGADNFVAWCWKGAGISTINTDGSITSITNANPAAGFSIVKYTGNGTAGATVGHGLSAAPEMIIIKNTVDAENWSVYSSPTGNTQVGHLNLTNAFSTTGDWNNTTPTTSVFTVGTSNRVNTTDNFIAYCFHSVSGYQKIGSYTGTGSSGNSVTTGFRPRFVMVKKSSGTGNWVIKDSQRDSTNPNSANLYPNLSNAENTVATLDMDFDDNGFTLDGTSGDVNGSSATYIYLAIK